MDDTTRYLSIQQIIDSTRYPFSQGQVRHFLLMRHKNGLESAVRRIGKRLYLRQDLFDQWIEKQSGNGGGR